MKMETTYKIGDMAETGVRGTLVVINAYVKKKERSSKTSCVLPRLRFLKSVQEHFLP